MEIKKKKIFEDACLNILAAALPIIYIQLIVFPLIAKAENVEKYGLMVAVYAIMMFTPNISGNALGNLRLIKQDLYERRTGDFNLLVFYYGIINFVVLIILLLNFYPRTNFLGMVLACVASILTFFNAYYEVEFSLKLSFRDRLLLRVFLVIGYALGTLLYLWLSYWELIFVGGQILTSIYLYKNSSLYKESWTRTEHYQETRNDSVFLVGASCVSSSLNYIDKLILFPLLGAMVVSVYNVATLMGKIVLLLIPPIKSLVLSYISRVNSINKKLVVKLLLICIGLCSVLYLGCIISSKYILELLYPQFSAEALEYVPITTLMIMLSTITALLQTIILKFCSIKWLGLIDTIAVIMYLVISFLMVKKIGLYGFCLGNLVSYMMKLIMLLAFFLKTYKEGAVKEC